MDVWKSIDGYDELYEVSNTGKVRSLPKKATYKGQSYLDGRELKQEIVKRNTTNYKRVSLSKNKKVMRFQVHRLVANAFIPNPQNKPYINHIDNNGENNNVLNLEWCTHSENMAHAQKQGRLFHAQSKGGKTLGKTEPMFDKYKKKEGNVYGGLKILSVNEKRGKHIYGTVECTKCNKTYESGIDAIVRNKPYGCRSCGIKQSYIRRNNGKK